MDVYVPMGIRVAFGLGNVGQADPEPPSRTDDPELNPLWVLTIASCVGVAIQLWVATRD